MLSNVTIYALSLCEFKCGCSYILQLDVIHLVVMVTARRTNPEMFATNGGLFAIVGVTFHVAFCFLAIVASWLTASQRAMRVSEPCEPASHPSVGPSYMVHYRFVIGLGVGLFYIMCYYHVPYMKDLSMRNSKPCKPTCDSTFLSFF